MAPSFADAGWVLATLALIAALAVRLRTRRLRQGTLVALDGAAVALLVVGLAIVVLTTPIDIYRHAGGPWLTYLVRITHPVLDTALLMAAAVFLTTARRTLQTADALLVAGAAAVAVLDVGYAVQLTNGDWHPGSLLASLSVVATAAIAYALTVGTRPLFAGRPTTTLAHAGLRHVALPITLTVLALAGLVTAGLVDAPDLAFPVYGLAMAAAILRGALTVADDRRAASLLIGAATLDRRRFEALVEASNDFIGIADRHAGVVYINPVGRRMLGLAPDQDVTRLTVGQLLGNQGREEVTNRWPALLANGGWRGRSTIVPVDGGESIPVEISTFVIPDPVTRRPTAVATIQRDIRQRLRAEAEVRALADQRAGLLARLVQAQEDERARIAADVHDDPVQALAAVDLRLGMLRRRAAEQAPGLVEAVDLVHSTVSTATERLRHLLFDLEPPAREAGLGHSLAEAGDVVFAGTQVRCEVTGDRDLHLPEAELVTAYRVAKEALVNVRKHADARRVVVDVTRCDGGVSVSVCDDGRGIAADEESGEYRPGHLGLPSMRDRAAAAGGTLSVGRREGGGTRVRLWLPLPSATG